MSFNIAATENDILKSTQVLADADALLAGVAGQGGTGASTAASALGALGALDLTDVGSDLPAEIVSTLNNGVLGLHQVAELFADQNGALGTVHGVTNLGETLGLGHIDTSGNPITTLLDTPSAVVSGNPGAVGSIVPELLHLDSAATGLLSGIAGDIGLNPSALGVLPEATGLTNVPGGDLLNGVVNNVHATLEATFDPTPLINTVHSLIGFGNSIGLGTIGGQNLLTDVLHLPSDLAAGNLTSLEHLPADIVQALNGLEGIASGVLADLGNAGNLSNPVATLTGLVDGLTHGSADGLLNGVVDNVHGTLETLSDSTPFPGLVHGVTGLGNAVGLGDLGGSNLATDLSNLPGSLASGDLTPVTHLPSDAGAIVGAIGNLANGAGSDLANNPVLGTLEHPATGGGILSGALPGQGVLGQVTGDVTSLLDGAHTGAGGLTGALNGLTGGLGDGGHSLLGTVTSAVGGATGGNLGGVTGALDGLTGALNGGGAGSHDLATVTVGPQTPTSGLDANVLSNGNGSSHAVDAHVGTAPAETPTVANLGLLSGGSFHFPTVSGGGDALSGLASSLVSTATHAAGGAAPAADVPPAAHVDLPVGAPHADPFAALAHPVLHAA